ncbi:hypothetical protein NFJ02_20g44210 [Pycnococcus provasolii]
MELDPSSSGGVMGTDVHDVSLSSLPSSSPSLGASLSFDASEASDAFLEDDDDLSLEADLSHMELQEEENLQENREDVPADEEEPLRRGRSLRNVNDEDSYPHAHAHGGETLRDGNAAAGIDDALESRPDALERFQQASDETDDDESDVDDELDDDVNGSEEEDFERNVVPVSGVNSDDDDDENHHNHNHNDPSDDDDDDDALNDDDNDNDAMDSPSSGQPSMSSQFQPYIDPDVAPGDTSDVAVALHNADAQGIPWSRLNFTRAKYRDQRLKSYKNYTNLEFDEEALMEQCTVVTPGNEFYTFKRNVRGLRPTIVHFQLRNLVAATSPSDVYVVQENCVVRHRPHAPHVEMPSSYHPHHHRWNHASVSHQCSHHPLAPPAMRTLAHVRRRLARHRVSNASLSSGSREASPSDSPSGEGSPRHPSASTSAWWNGNAATRSPFSSAMDQQQQRQAADHHPMLRNPAQQDLHRRASSSSSSSVVSTREVLNLRGGPTMPPQLDKTSVQVSTLGANGSLVVAGGFSGELVAKRMHTFRHDYAPRTYAAGDVVDDEGVTHVGRITSCENAITNALEVFHDASCGMSQFASCAVQTTSAELRDEMMRSEGQPLSADEVSELPYEEYRSHFECVPNRVLASSNDHVVRMYDAERWGDPVLSVRMDWPANCASVDPYRRLMCIVGDDPRAVIVDARSGQHLVTLEGHADFSFACAWHPTGLSLATGNQDATARIWDARNWSRSVCCLPGRIGAMRSLRYSYDGRFLAGAEAADFCHVWDVSCGYRRSQTLDIFGEIAGISYTPLLDSCESHHQRESLFVGVNDPAYGSVMEYRRASEDRWGDMAI